MFLFFEMFSNYLTFTTVIFSAQMVLYHMRALMETSTSTKTRAWCGLFPTVENRLVAILVVLQEEVVLPTRVRIKYPAVECFELAPSEPVQVSLCSLVGPRCHRSD